MKELICKNITYLRESNSLTKKEMAQALGISVSTLYKIEKGISIHCIHSGRVHRICDHFGITADSFLLTDLSQQAQTALTNP